MRYGRHDWHAVRLVASGLSAMMVWRCMFIEGIIVGYLPGGRVVAVYVRYWELASVAG
jgi:hypothetical protein